MKYSEAKENESPAHQKKDKSFASDVLTLVGGTAFAQIVALLAAPILTRLYGPEDFGVWALFISVTGIIGVIACLRYELSIMLPESDEDAVNLLALSLAIVLLISIITIPLIYVFKNSLVLVLNSPQLGDYVWLIPPFIFISGVFLALNYWNSRTKKFKRLSFARVSSSLSSTGTQIGAGIGGYATGIGLIAGSLVGNFISTIVLGAQIWKDDNKLFRTYTNPKMMLQGLKRHRKFPLIDSWSALLNSISWQLPAFLLAFFFSPAIVGFYSLGFRLLQMPMNFVGKSLSQVFFQRASIASSENNLNSLVENVFRVLVIVGMFPILTVTVVGSDIFSVVFGQEWTEAGVYAQILSIWAFVWFISSPLSSIYVVLEKQQFGLKFNAFNFATRILSLSIGGYLGNARIALILFAVSGVLVYGYLCLKMMHYAEVKMSRVVKIIISNLLYFIPAGIILIFLKLYGVDQFIIVGASGMLVASYYLYIIATDKQLRLRTYLF
ncbi:lipopolysaccharide biosynthesis protein [Methanolobus halotolerans]|uniref:Translocase n=1 Tax=Methanolobus halotolerans TaxID=2052935 RepID=A0A4E0Q3V4_9EURY|nr:oligosaccharide flippase family protein [Methanolobus halotolerans]TGC08295.1 translocase [Methanolobus halotolerans]